MTVESDDGSLAPDSMYVKIVVMAGAAASETGALGAAPCCGLARARVDEAAATRLAPVFKALGDPIRLRLAAMIASAPEVCVCDLTPAFDVSGPTISHHLKVLREARLVESERRGTWVYYRIRPEALAELASLLG